jgi:hypothetical protein
MEWFMSSNFEVFYRYKWVKRHPVAAMPIVAVLGAVFGMTVGALWYYIDRGDSLIERVAVEGVVGTLLFLVRLRAEYRNDKRTKRDRADVDPPTPQL